MADGSILIDSKIDEKGIDKGISSLQSKMGKVSSKMTSVGTGMSKAVTLPILAVGAAGLAAAVKLDDAYNTIRRGTGATGEDLESLKENFKNVFKNVPESADEVSTALADLNTRTGQTGEPLEALTKQFLELGRVSGEDVPTLIASGTRAFGDWGIAVGDQSDTMDYFWKVSQTTGIGVDKLASQMVQFGAPLRQMGFDFDTSAALLGKFEKEGVNAELVMGSMRQALGKMAKQGIDAETGLNKTVESIKNAGSASEANALAIELFGARAGPDMAAAIREGRFEVDELLATLGSSEETIGKAAADTQTLGDRFSMLKNNTMLALEPIGKILMEFAEKWIPPLIAAVQKMAEWFGKLSPTMQLMAVVIGVIFAAIGPFLVVLAMIISSIGTMIPVILKVWGVLSKLAPIFHIIRTAMMVLMGPIGLIGIAVGVLAFLIYKYWDEIKAITKAVFSWIGDFLVMIWDGIKAYFTFMLAVYKTIFTAAFNAIKTVISVAVGVIKTVITFVFDAIKTYLTFALNLYKTIFLTVFNAIKTIILTVVNVIKTIINTVFNWIKTYLTTVLNIYKTVFMTVWNAIRTAVQTIVNAIKTVISTVFNTIKTVISIAMNSIKTAISTTWNSIKTIISTAINNVKSTISNGMAAALKIVTDIGKKFKEAGGKIISMLADGITGAIGKATGAIGNVVSKVRDFLPFSPAKEGPLSDLDHLDFAGPIMDSIKGGQTKVEHAMSSLLQMPDMNGLVANASMGGGGSVQPNNTTHQNNGVTINVQNMNVRDENDVQSISRDLYEHVTRSQRGRGNR